MLNANKTSDNITIKCHITKTKTPSNVQY